MTEPFAKKIKRILYRAISFFTGHEYGCCDHVFKRCSKCKYVKED